MMNNRIPLGHHNVVGLVVVDGVEELCGTLFEDGSVSYAGTRWADLISARRYADRLRRS